MWQMKLQIIDILNQREYYSNTNIGNTDAQATFASIVAKEKTPRKKRTATATDTLLESIVSGMQEVKAYDITVLDLRKLHNSMADYFVVCHGSSNTQVHAISQSVEKFTAQMCNDKPWHVEGAKNAQWVLMDYIDIVVHVFDKEARQFYCLEDLWADAETRRIED